MVLFMTLVGGVNAAEQSIPCDLKKIFPNIADIAAAGAYEFCIPYQDEYLKEIKEIEPLMECLHGPKGRIGCADDEYLCIGGTRSEDFNNTLCELSTLDYIKLIGPCYFE